MDEQFIRERITQLRMQKGVSEYKMSYDLGHSRSYINNISSGKALPSMGEFLAICDYFEISPIAFFDTETENPHQTQALINSIKQLSPQDQALVSAVIARLLAKE